MIHLRNIALTFTGLLCSSLTSAQTWADVNGGVDFSIWFNNPTIYSLYNDTANNRLIVGGAFDMTGGVVGYYNIATWNGNNWDSLGSGIGVVQAIEKYNGDIYAGGNGGVISPFSIARWNGTAWTSIGPAFSNGFIYDMQVYNGELYVAGSFDSIGNIPVNNIARWNGSAWTSVGTGTDHMIRTLYAYNNELYVGGLFDTADGTPANHIAKWDGLSWSALGSGISPGAVNDMIAYNGDLFVCGAFTTAGGNAVSNVAKWNGTSWSSAGMLNGQAHAFGIGGNILFCTGSFTITGSNGIGQWSGSSWVPLAGGGIIGSMQNSLMGYQGDLFIGGDIGQAGPVIVDNIARYILPTSISEPGKANGARAYPNPAKDHLFLSLPHANENYVLQLFDLQGRSVMHRKMQAQENTVDISALSPGTYILQLHTETGEDITELISVVE